jgi:hypothetical protein
MKDGEEKLATARGRMTSEKMAYLHIDDKGCHTSVNQEY